MTSFKLGLVFTGHMIDLPGRETPRFPPAAENSASTIIRRRVAYAKRAEHNGVIGIASGARGGDILFLEACRDAGLDIHIVLPFAVNTFLDNSVRGVTQGGWEKRFFDLWNGVRSDRREVLTVLPEHNPYDFCNRHMLDLAKTYAPKIRLLALWDGMDREIKPGGTASFVALVKSARGRFAHIDTAELLRETS